MIYNNNKIQMQIETKFYTPTNLANTKKKTDDT